MLPLINLRKYIFTKEINDIIQAGLLLTKSKADPKTLDVNKFDLPLINSILNYALRLPKINNLDIGLCVGRYSKAGYYTALFQSKKIKFTLNIRPRGYWIKGFYYIDVITKTMVNFVLTRKTNLEHYRLEYNKFKIMINTQFLCQGTYDYEKNHIIIYKPKLSHSYWPAYYCINVKQFIYNDHRDMYAYAYVYTYKKLKLMVYNDNRRDVKIITKYKHQQPFKTIIRCNKKRYVKYI